MDRVLRLTILGIGLAIAGCGQLGSAGPDATGRTPSGSDTGVTDTGGGTMNNPAGTARTSGAETPGEVSSSSTETGAAATQEGPPAATGSGVGTAGLTGGVTGAGTSPATRAGTGTGPTP